MNLRLAAVPVCLMLEAGAGVLVLADSVTPLNVMAGVGMHVVAAALFGWTTGRSRSQVPDRVTPVLSSLVALLGFPLFGMVAVLSGSVAIASLALRPRRLTTSADRPRRPVAPAQARKLDVFGVLDVEPIVDALSGSDPVLKQGAIDALVRSQRYRAVGTLRSLLLDPASEIRLYASVTLTKLEDEIGQAMLDARHVTLQDSPDAAAWETLAWLYVEYASCGFIVQPTVDQYLKLAGGAYEAALDQQPDQSRLALALGRAHMLFGQSDVAEEYFQSAAMRRITNPGVHLALMELAYDRGAVAEVSRRASTAARLLAFDYPQRGLVNWWASAV